MSRDSCKYCDGYVFKTDGNADHICESRALTGECGISTEQAKEFDRESFDTGMSRRALRRADVRKSKGKRKYGFW